MDIEWTEEHHETGSNPRFAEFPLSWFSCPSVLGSWIIFHKAEFKGRIIDAETKQPIEDVVVVAMYRTHSIISGPGGGSSSVIHVKEALTDARVEFLIPSYTTMIQPNSHSDFTNFIIYKPGYASYTALYHDRIYPLKYRGPEVFFTKELGTKDEIRKGSQVVTITNGVVELPKIESKEERLRAILGRPSGLAPEEAPLLYEAINEERKHFGLRPVGRVRNLRNGNLEKEIERRSAGTPVRRDPRTIPPPPPGYRLGHSRHMREKALE